MNKYTGVTYTNIPTKPLVVALQFYMSDLISYINIIHVILGVVKMWNLREYNTLCLQPSDDNITMTKARVMALSDDINCRQLMQIIKHTHTCTYIDIYTNTHTHTYIHQTFIQYVWNIFTSMLISPGTQETQPDNNPAYPEIPPVTTA